MAGKECEDVQAQADGHGWMPWRAEASDPAVARAGESGQWWALYYTGLTTLVNTAADMAARAQIIRRHDYAMRGLKVPRHALPPAPRITSAAARLYWQGSAGAQRYSIERAAARTGPWTTPCSRCATDRDDGWPVPGP